MEEIPIATFVFRLRDDIFIQIQFYVLSLHAALINIIEEKEVGELAEMLAMLKKERYAVGPDTRHSHLLAWFHYPSTNLLPTNVSVSVSENDIYSLNVAI